MSAVFRSVMSRSSSSSKKAGKTGKRRVTLRLCDDDDRCSRRSICRATGTMATLTAPKDFSPVEDAESLKKAFQGWGTDERAVISILGHRNLFQRRLIRAAYEEIYQEDLVSQLQSELSGHFQKALTHWILDPADRDALLVHSELGKLVPDCRVVAEIACIRSPEDLLGVKRAYSFRYKRSLEEDVASHTTGNVRKILVALVSAYRYDGNEISEEMAESEARILHDEIHGNDRNLEETVRILSTRSKAQLNAAFNHYKDIYKTSITKGLTGDSADEYLPLLRTAIRCIKDPKKYLAKVLRSAINMVGTDQQALSRVIVSSAEKDLEDIKEVFLRRNNVSLEEAVAKDTSGDYKNFLLALLGSEDHSI